MVKKLKICIIGAESWGSAIATAVGANAFNSAKIDNRVHLYVYDDLVCNNNLSDVINDTHENIKYLPGIHLPENLIAINDLLDAARDADVLIFSTPNHFVKSYCNILEGQIKSSVIAVSLVQGFERTKDGEIDLFTNGISGQLGIPCYSFVTANSAMEMAQGKLCEVTIGCDNAEHSQLLREVFQTMNCKVVLLPDVEGVELCGALKSVIAIGAGFVDGLHLGYNARVAVIHLGLKEIMRFVKNFYPNTKLSTFFESCGVADLVASCYDDNNVSFAKKFVTSGKTLQELESSLPCNKELLGPQIVEQVYDFLSKSNKEDQYPLFTAIHKICQNEQHPETIIEALRNHPDLHYPSITNLLNSELTPIHNDPAIPVYVVDDPDLLESQNKDDLITSEYQPVKSVSKTDDMDYTEFQNENNFLRITAEHEPPEFVQELDNTDYMESQSKGDLMKITSEYQPIKSVYKIDDIDYMVSRKKDNFLRVSAADRHSGDFVSKMNDTDNAEPQNKNLLEITSEKKQGQSVGSDFSNPQSITIQFRDVPEFGGSRNINIVDSTSGAPNDPTHDDWMGDNEWRPQDFEVNEIEYPSGEQPNKISDNPVQEDWMGDNEWRPQDVNVKMEYSVDNDFALSNKVDKSDIGGTSEDSPEKETVKILLDFKFGDNEENNSVNKLVSNFVALSSKDPEAHQNVPANTKPVIYKSLSDYQQQNLLKPTKQVDLYDTEIDEYAMGPYSHMGAEAFTSSPDLTSDTLESNEDYKTKSVEIASLNSDNENYQTPRKGAFESEFDHTAEIQEPVMEINDNIFENKNIGQGTKFEIEDTIGDSFFDPSQVYLEESQYENIHEVPKIEMKDSSSNDKGIDQAPPKVHNIERNNDPLKSDCAYNEIFEELANTSPQDKKSEQKLRNMENATDFDEIFAELEALSSTQNKSNNKIIPKLEMKKLKFAIDFDSMIKELGKAALENERSRRVAKMNVKDDLQNERNRQIANMKMSKVLENERSRQVANMNMKNELENEMSRKVAMMNMKDDLVNERSREVTNMKINDDLRNEMSPQVTKQNRKESIAAEHTQNLKGEPKTKIGIENTKQRTADTNLNISHGITSAINSTDINKIDSGNIKNKEQLTTWINLFEKTDKEETKLNSPNDKIKEKSSFDAFKTPNEEEEMDKMLTQAYEDDLSKQQKPEWNWTQLSSEQENNNEIVTGNEKAITNEINAETGPENVTPQKINEETVIKSEQIEENAQKDNPPNILSEKSNPAVPEQSFQLTTSPEGQHQQPSVQNLVSNEPSSDVKSVSVKIVDLERFDKDPKQETSTHQNELESSIDSVHSFVEKMEKPVESTGPQSWEALAEATNTETPKPAPESKTAEELGAVEVQSNFLDSKPEIQDEQKANEPKPESFITTKLKYLMNNKLSNKHPSPYSRDRNLHPFDRSVDSADELKTSKHKSQQEQKYVLRTPFHPPLNPRVRRPQPPFDGREHEYHTLAYRLPRLNVNKQTNLRRIQANCTRSEVIGKMPPVHRAKSFFSIMRANKVFCAFQAGLFAAIFSRFGKP